MKVSPLISLTFSNSEDHVDYQLKKDHILIVKFALSSLQELTQKLSVAQTAALETEKKLRSHMEELSRKEETIRKLESEVAR